MRKSQLQALDQDLAGAAADARGARSGAHTTIAVTAPRTSTPPSMLPPEGDLGDDASAALRDDRDPPAPTRHTATSRRDDTPPAALRIPPARLGDGDARALALGARGGRLALAADSSTFRSRIDFGVTSTASSSRMNSSACSSESGRGGIRRTSSSADAARMFVSFFGFDGVHVEVVVARVLADDHPLVELVAGRDEERAALLQRLDREAGRLPAAVGDEAAGRPRAQLAVPRLPAPRRRGGGCRCRASR